MTKSVRKKHLLRSFLLKIGDIDATVWYFLSKIKKIVAKVWFFLLKGIEIIVKFVIFKFVPVALFFIFAAIILWAIWNSWQLWQTFKFSPENQFTWWADRLPQLVGGLLLLGGIWVAYMRSEALQQTAATGIKSEQATRYVESVKQLGAVRQSGAVRQTKDEEKPNIELRIGGLFGLEKLMKEAPGEYHHEILSLLCSYLRENAEEAPADPNAKQETLREDVRTCLQIIASREVQDDEERIRLNQLDFSGCQLIGAQFEDSYLDGIFFRVAILEGANFVSGWLEGANFTGADLEEAYFADADLMEANFTNANLAGANFIGARLGEANFTDAELGKDDVKTLLVNFSQADSLTKSQLLSAKYIGTIILPKGQMVTSKEELKRYYNEDLTPKKKHKAP